MKRSEFLKLVAFFVAIAGFVAMSFFPTRADCVYCPAYRCFGATCGQCVCISPPGGGGGSCYGVERVPQLVAKGHRVLE